MSQVELHAPTFTLIEDVQDRIDHLVLNIFEGARGHENPSSGAAAAQQILDSYVQAVETVQLLVGIDKTKADQEIKLAALTEEYSSLKLVLVGLEEELHEMMRKSDECLDNLLDYRHNYTTHSTSDKLC